MSSAELSTDESFFTDEIGRCFCAEHRSESCDACMYDWVEMNRMAEADHLAASAAATPPVPPSPASGSGAFTVGDVIIVHGLQSSAVAQALNGTSAVVTTSAPNEKGRWGINVGSTKMHRIKGINMRVPSTEERKRLVSPALLPDWSRTRCVSSEFLDAMSGMEKMRSTFGVQQGAAFGNRESWTLIANYIDSAKGVGPDERLLTKRGQVPPSYGLEEPVRIMYQCTDKSRGVIVDIIGVKSRVAASDGMEEPLILCNFCEIAREQMLQPGFTDRVIVQTSRSRHLPFGASMNVEREEHAVLMRMLRKNEKLLDPTFRKYEAERRSASDGWRTAFVSPTSLESKPSFSKGDAGAPQCSRPGCAKRGKSTCMRCKQVRYCSVSCQKIHWKEAHKKECKATTLTRPFVEYDVTFIEPAQREMVHMNMSFEQSVRASRQGELPFSILCASQNLMVRESRSQW